jgi:hypothetical protein
VRDIRAELIQIRRWRSELGESQRVTSGDESRSGNESRQRVSRVEGDPIAVPPN